MAAKLWRVSQVLSDRNPFSEQMLALNEAQMDFILTMRSRDRPNELKFERRRDVLARVRSQTQITSRANVSTGKAMEALRAQVSFKLPEAYRTSGSVRRGAPPPVKEPRTPPQITPRPPRAKV